MQNRNMFRDRYVLGGSDMAVVLGWSPYASAFELYWRIKGRIPRDEDTEAAELGRELESTVLRLYEKRTGRTRAPGFDEVQPDRFPWLVLHPDWVGERDGALGVVDAKCPDVIVWQRRWHDGEEVPQEYGPQIATYVHALELAWCGFVCLVGNSKLRWFDLPAEALRSVWDACAEVGPEFVRRLELDDPPPPREDERDCTMQRVVYGEQRQAKAWLGAIHTEGRTWMPDEADRLWTLSQRDERLAHANRKAAEAAIRHAAAGATRLVVGQATYTIGRSLRRIAGPDYDSSVSADSPVLTTERGAGY